jgi:Uma2 family endonuclease
MHSGDDEPMTTAAIAQPVEWTDEEFDALPETGYRTELIDGVLHVSPVPIGRHSRVARRLANAIEAAAPSGYAVLNDYEIKLSDSLRYVPDVVVMTAEAYGDGERCRCAPADVALAVEVVSVSSRRMDRILKPRDYAAAGIPLYWRVELTPRLEILVYEIGPSGDYKETGRYLDRFEVDRPWPITLDLGSLIR